MRSHCRIFQLRSMDQVGIMLDLDDTVYDHSVKNCVQSFLPVEEWVELLDELRAYAKKHDVFFRFAIVTGKQKPDDITDQAAKSFAKYLYFQDPENFSLQPVLHQMKPSCIPRYFAMENNGHHQGFISAAIGVVHDIKYDNQRQPFCNFHINDREFKTDIMKKLAAYWGLKVSNFLMCDDDQSNLVKAEASGIPTISFASVKTSENKAAESRLLLTQVRENVMKKIDDIVSERNLVNQIYKEAAVCACSQ